MRRRNGFTLIELIVSISLLFIVSTFLLQTLAHSYKIMGQTRTHTEDIFAMMTKVEQTIVKARDGHSGTVEYPLFVFGRDLTIRELEFQVPNYVGNMTDFKIYLNSVSFPIAVPEVTLNLRLKGSEQAIYYDPDDLSGNAVASTGTVDNHGVATPKYVYEWRRASGFYTTDNSALAPHYPTQFAKVPGIPREPVTHMTQNQDLKNLILENHLGTFVIATVEPVGDLGKAGERTPSNMVYVSGLPVSSPTGEPALHLDAGVLHGAAGAANTLSEWKGFLISQGKAVTHTDAAEVKTMNFFGPIGGEKTINTQIIHFAGQDNNMETTFASGPTNFTIFMVVQSGGGETDFLYCEDGGDWLFGLNGLTLNAGLAEPEEGEEDDESSEYEEPASEPEEPGEPEEPEESPDTSWHLIALHVKYGALKCEASFSLDGEVVSVTEIDPAEAISLSEIELGSLGGKGCNIAEAIFYTKALNLSEDDYGNVTRYLMRKYINPNYT